MSTEIAIPEERSPSRESYNDYSRERKGEILALYYANGQNLKQTALEVGINPATIRYWLDTGIEIQTKTKADLAQKFENAANFYLDLAEDKAAEAPFNHLMTGAGIAVDKMQLLRGLPTSITENVDRQELVVLLQTALGETISDSVDVLDVESRMIGKGASGEQE